jgi:hypothetical protein
MLRNHKIQLQLHDVLLIVRRCQVYIIRNFQVKTRKRDFTEKSLSLTPAAPLYKFQIDVECLINKRTGPSS